MKNKFILLALGLLIMSCSNDDNSNNTAEVTEEVIVDESGNTPPDEGSPDYMQDTNGNFWVYETQSIQGDGRDSLYIANDTVINNVSHKKYKTGQPATGFYSTMLTGGAVRKSDGKVMVTGNLNLDAGMGMPLNINLENFIIYDENAGANQQLSINNGTVNQEIEGMNVSITYILSSQSKEIIGAYTGVQGKTYNDVKPVEIRLKMQINVNYSGFVIPILPMQDVLISTQYYSADTGAVHIMSDLQYEFTDMSGFGVELPVPQTGSVQQQEILVNHKIQ